MSERKPFTVENQRPRRTVNVLGRILAPRGHGRNSQCDVDLGELTKLVRQFKVGRLALVRGAMPAAIAQAINPDEVAPPTPAVETPLPAPAPEPVVEVPVVEEPPPVVEPVVEEPLVEDLPAEPTLTHTEDSLSKKTYAILQGIAREMKLSASGKKVDLIARILAGQD